MKKWIGELQHKISNTKIQKQLSLIYVITMLVPLMCIGAFLLFNTSRLLLDYHSGLIESDNLRVKTILFEITSQIYNISEDIIVDEVFDGYIDQEFQSEDKFVNTMKKYTTTQNYTGNYPEIADIKIYVDAPNIKQYKQFYKVDEEVAESEWYQKAISQFSVFWYPIKEIDKYGNEYWKLALVRKLPMVQTGQDAVLVITISDNYLKSRIDNNQYRTLVSTEKGIVFYGTNRMYYGKDIPVSIDYTTEYFHDTENREIDGKKYLATVSSLKLYQSDSKLYITSLNGSAYSNTVNIVVFCLIIIAIAAILPGIIMHFFIRYFVARINSLREEMHKTSNENYNLVDTIYGKDEISEAFADLQIMVNKIKQKDMEMYETRINEQTLKTQQQVMEFKMLSSQINPHFLYNTLETIRMKALTAGNTEVAKSIMLLGKSMRYVLENTGTASTTLKNEVSYLETYLLIQKSRFQEKINFSIVIEEGMILEEYSILPLLLQPVVENAILHGLEEVEENGHITIEIKRERDELIYIIIEDNGCGMTDEQLSALMAKINKPNQKLQSSIGLYNIHQRIKLCYGEIYGMKVESTLGKGTKVTLVIPQDNI